MILQNVNVTIYFQISNTKQKLKIDVCVKNLNDFSMFFKNKKH